MQTPEPNGPFAMTKISPPRGSSHYAARTYGCCFTAPAQPLLNGAGWAVMTAVMVNQNIVTDAASTPNLIVGNRCDTSVPGGLCGS